MARTPFFLVLADHDSRKFNVIGPITDDTLWIESVNKCKKEGRNVQCFMPQEGKKKGNITTEYAAQMNYDYVENSVLNSQV